MTYTPSAGYSGPDSFQYYASGPGGASTKETVSLTVAPNAAPAPVASSFAAGAMAYGATAQPIDLAPHATNSPTSYALGAATTTNGGGVSVNASGVVSYTAPSGFRGSDSFTYTATNAGGASSAATVTVPVSDPTLAIALSGTSGAAGTALSGVSVTVSGGKAGYACATTPASGSLPAGVTLGANCALAGTPTTAGAATFTVAVTDSSTAPVRSPRRAAR